MAVGPRPALAQDAGTDASAAGTSFAEELEAAKAMYFQGDLDQGLLAFRALQLRYVQTPQTVPFDEAVDALTYLGEILVKKGEDEEASRVFRTILEEDLDLRISPYHHPADVVFVFNRVREQIAAERAAEVPEKPTIPPAPATTYLPLGLPQLARGRVGPGLWYGGGQALLGGIAIGTYLHLELINSPNDNQDHPLGWSDEQIVRRTQIRRYGLQWSATFGFYALWTASVVEARGHWRRTQLDGQARGQLVPMLVPPVGTAEATAGAGFVGLSWTQPLGGGPRDGARGLRPR